MNNQTEIVGVVTTVGTLYCGFCTTKLEKFGRFVYKNSLPHCEESCDSCQRVINNRTTLSVVDYSERYSKKVAREMLKLCDYKHGKSRRLTKNEVRLSIKHYEKIYIEYFEKGELPERLARKIHEKWICP